MQLYLRLLEKYEMRQQEELPIGLILCADNKNEKMELLMIVEKRIKVANYMTEMPEAKIIKQKSEKSHKQCKSKHWKTVA